MPNFRVVWEIDIEAERPEEAAETARDYQTALGTTATVFDVRDEAGRSTRIDLAESPADNVDVTIHRRPPVQRRARYVRERKQSLAPIQISQSRWINLNPGDHSELIRAIIEDFGSRFVPGGVLIYAGDTGEKMGYCDAVLLGQLGVTVDSHGKMPDVVLYCPKRKWLVLIESVTSHGPVDGKRHSELEQLFSTATPGLVYVTAFSNRAIMGRYLTEIAWETEVWVADAPSHLIHFNGERFLGPYGPS